MNASHFNSSALNMSQHAWRGRLQAGALLVLAALAGCGGGGSEPAASNPPAANASFALGPITGYGSIVVNGVHFDERTASVTDDDGRAHASSDLKLGMVVEVAASAIDKSTLRATAQSVRFGAEVSGPVGSIDLAAGTFTVLGQTVVVSSTTLFDDSLAGGLAGLATGTVVEVHAQLNAATGQYQATRIEAQTGATSFKLRGAVSGLDTTAKTFSLGTAVVSYANIAAADLPANLADGLKVRVKLSATQVNGQWVVTSVRSGVRKVEDQSDAHVRGTVSAVTSATLFSIDGVPVDAGAASWPDGTSGLVVGAHVEVEGTVTNGVLMATKVELEDKHSADDDRNKPEFSGAVSSLDLAAKTFKVQGRSETISYAAAVTYKNGTEADLANGTNVEVKGRVSADGNTVTASRIEFKR